MENQKPRMGTNALLLLISLLSGAEIVLMYLSLFFHKAQIDSRLWIVFLLWAAYASGSWVFGRIFIYQEGTFALAANPPVKPGCYRWFLVFYVPQLCFSLFLTLVLLAAHQLFAALAAAALLVWKALCLRKAGLLFAASF